MMRGHQPSRQFHTNSVDLPQAARSLVVPLGARLAFDADLWSSEEFPTQTVVYEIEPEETEYPAVTAERDAILGLRQDAKEIIEEIYKFFETTYSYRRVA
jgi:hypothetical protein